MSYSNPLNFNFDSSLKPQAELQHERHLALFDDTNLLSSLSSNARQEEIKTAPLFSSHVQAAIAKGSVGIQPSQSNQIFPQYGLLGMRQKTIGAAEGADPVPEPHQNLIYTNTNAPWSAFICGSQGGGKSHTLSCLLENALLTTSPAGTLPNPLAGLVFHYDKFTSHSSSQLCEAAYLCSSGVPVRVLVSPSNVWAMEKIYSNLPGLPKGGPRPQVVPLYISEKQLNVTNMMTLMSVDSASGHPPLYIEVLFKVLRDMAMENRGAPGLKYSDFKQRLAGAGFSGEQAGPLKLRLQLLEAFMEQLAIPGAPAKPKTTDVWQFEKGSLTIIDLSCPFVNENDACALFSICLSLFMEGRSIGGRIVALDEAHKFLTESSDAKKFTEQLTSIIAQQRHLATRVVIATQEPTLSPRLLDLCNVTIVHRFDSPAWYHTLRNHLAGTSLGEKKNESGLEIFREIVSLKTGEALVFCPKAMLDTVTENPGYLFIATASIRELQGAYFKMQVRKRITADGGKSIMAIESSQSPVPTPLFGNLNLTAKAAAPTALEISRAQPLVSKPERSASSFQKSKDVASLVFNSAQSPFTKVETLESTPRKQIQIEPKATTVAPPAAKAVKQIGDKRTGSDLTKEIYRTATEKETYAKSSDESEESKESEYSESSAASTPVEKKAVDAVSRQMANTTLSVTRPTATRQATTRQATTRQATTRQAKTSWATTSQATTSQATTSQATTSQTTNTQKSFVFKFDSTPKGAPVFPVFRPLEKGVRPDPVKFREREELDPTLMGVKNRHQSINAGSSWYKRLSFEEIRMHEMGMMMITNTKPVLTFGPIRKP